MDSERRLIWPCCFEVKLGTQIILWAESAIAAILFFEQLDVVILSNNLKYALENDGVYLFTTLLITVCNLIGLLGIKRGNPTLLIPGLLFKTLAFLLISAQLVYYLHEVVAYIFVAGAVFFLVLGWACYSVGIVYQCYKEMKGDSNTNEPTEYSQFIDEPA